MLANESPAPCNEEVAQSTWECRTVPAVQHMKATPAGRNGGDREGSNSSSESGVVVVRAAEDESLFERASRAIEMALQQIEQVTAMLHCPP